MKGNFPSLVLQAASTPPQRQFLTKPSRGIFVYMCAIYMRFLFLKFIEVTLVNCIINL